MTENEKNFDGATFYDCGDPEELHYESPSEAIEAHLDNAWEVGNTAMQTLDYVAPLEVKAFVPKKIPKGFGESAIDRMLEDFDENYWCEEFGNPIDGGHEPWTGDELKALKAKLYAVMDEALSHADVWQCDVVATRTYSEDEVRALVPDWFSR